MEFYGDEIIGFNLIKKLQTSNVKCSIENIVFIIEDDNKHLIWLETGNERAGLTHIIQRHFQDFKNIGYDTEDKIVRCLYDVLKNGHIISQRPSKYADGEDRIYDFDGVHYIFSGLGKNGFIVTAFPVTM